MSHKTYYEVQCTITKKLFAYNEEEARQDLRYMIGKGMIKDNEIGKYGVEIIDYEDGLP